MGTCKYFFNNYVKQKKFEVYISDVVIEEIEKTNDVEKRTMEVAAAGKHNLFLFVLPGSGKTMAADGFLLPSHDHATAVPAGSP